MPKFNELNDNEIKNNCLLISKELAPCSTCKEPTKYIDYISEGRFCSTECIDRFYDFYEQNIKQSR